MALVLASTIGSGVGNTTSQAQEEAPNKTASAQLSGGGQIEKVVEALTELVKDRSSQIARRLALQEINTIDSPDLVGKAKPLAALVALELAEPWVASYISEQLLLFESAHDQAPILAERLKAILIERGAAYPVNRRPADMLKGVLAAKESESFKTSVELLKALPESAFSDLKPYLDVARQALPAYQALDISRSARLLIGEVIDDLGNNSRLSPEELAKVWQGVTSLASEAHYSAELVAKSIIIELICRDAGDPKALSDLKRVVSLAPALFQEQIPCALLNPGAKVTGADEILGVLPEHLKERYTLLAKIPVRAEDFAIGSEQYSSVVSPYTRPWKTLAGTEMPPYREPRLITLADLSVSLETPLQYEYRGEHFPSMSWAHRLLQPKSGIPDKIYSDYRELSEGMAKRDLNLVYQSYLNGSITQSEFGLGLLVIALKYPGINPAPEASQILERFIERHKLSELRDIVCGRQALPLEFLPLKEPLKPAVLMLASSDRALRDVASLLIRNMPHTSLLQQDIIFGLGAVLAANDAASNRTEYLASLNPGRRLELLTVLRETELPEQYHKARFDLFLAVIDRFCDDDPLFEYALTAIGRIPAPASCLPRKLELYLDIAADNQLAPEKRALAVAPLAELKLPTQLQQERATFLLNLAEDPLTDSSLQGAAVRKMTVICDDLWDLRHELSKELLSVKRDTREGIIRLIDLYVKRDLVQAVDLLGALSLTRDLRNKPIVAKYVRALIDSPPSLNGQAPSKHKAIKNIAAYSILNHHLEGMAEVFAEVVNDPKAHFEERVMAMSEIDNVVAFSSVFSGRLSKLEARQLSSDLLGIARIPASDQDDLKIRLVAMANYLSLQVNHTLPKNPDALEALRHILTDPRLEVGGASYLLVNALEYKDCHELLISLTEDPNLSAESRQAIKRALLGK
jgi:hypothetical protein